MSGTTLSRRLSAAIEPGDDVYIGFIRARVLGVLGHKLMVTMETGKSKTIPAWDISTKCSIATAQFLKAKRRSEERKKSYKAGADIPLPKMTMTSK